MNKWKYIKLCELKKGMLFTWSGVDERPALDEEIFELTGIGFDCDGFIEIECEGGTTGTMSWVLEEGFWKLIDSE